MADPPPQDDATPIVVGVDIGGTGTRFVAVDPATGEVLTRRTVPTPHTAGPDAILAFFRRHVQEASRGRRPVAVGIGASGPIDVHGVIHNPDTLPAFTGLPITEMVADLVPGPVAIENDAVCAALAERRFGAARRSTRSLHVTLGTGVGVCLLDGDTPYRYADGTHPEGGHIAVSIPTTPCYCGRTACWEQAASRRNLQRAAARILGRNPTDSQVIDDLVGRATGGDNAAQEVFDDYGTGIAAGLATLLTLYGPDLVIIGGSAARHLTLYQNAMSDALAILGTWVPQRQPIATQLDDFSGAIGGASLVLTAVNAG